MRYIKSIFFFVVCFGAALGFVHSCATKVVPPVTQIQYIQVVDSARIIELKNILRLTQDSLNVYKHDTIMSEDEFVIRYKLERIRYYNELAGKGNNIKFIRGWINRVINE